MPPFFRHQWALSLVATLFGVSACMQRSSPTPDETMYRRYSDFASYVEGGTVEPHWLPDGNRFWYASGPSDSMTLFLVDPLAGTKQTLADGLRLQAALRTAGFEPSAGPLPFADLIVLDEGTSLEMRVGGRRLMVSLPDFTITDLGADDLVEPAAFIDRMAWQQTEKPSPDGRWYAGIEGDNLYVRSAADSLPIRLTSDGTRDGWWEVEGWPEPGSIWSPDGNRLAIRKVDARGVARVPVVRHREGPPRVDSVLYPWEGDVHEKASLFLVDVPSGERREIAVGAEPGGNVILLSWRPDGREFYLLRSDRFYRTLELLGADAETGQTRVILTERAETGYLYSHPERENLFTLLPGGDRFVWKSNRSGIDQLYLYALDGTLIETLTSSPRPVLEVVHVDSAAGWVYFVAQGVAPRIYDTHVYRVPLGGGTAERLTDTPGQHHARFGVFSWLYRVQFSPSGRFFLDTHSDTDRPPRVDLRRSDGSLVLTLETARFDPLDELRWTSPEPFVVTAADDSTEVHGVLFRPHDFDPALEYPVIDWVYGSMDGTVVPRTFVPNPMGLSAQAMAQLGFVTVMLDTRGTGGRDKAFRDVVYGTVGKFETADRVAALRQLAESRPWMDMERVGIAGGSYGGYMTLYGMLTRPDFYRVGVATAPVIDLARHPNELFMGPREDGTADYESTAMQNLAANLEGKLLIVHGTADTAIPFAQLLRLIDALIAADRPFDLVVIPGEDHGGLELWEGYGREAERRYFQEHLGSGERD